MKISHFLLGTLPLLAASCSNDEIVDAVQSQDIGFSTFVDNATRAESSELDEDALKSKGFAVWGVTWNQEDGTNDPMQTIFVNQLVSYDSSQGWTYTPLRFWTAGNEYRFTALAPYYVAGTSGILTNVEQITTKPSSFSEVKGGLRITFNNQAADANEDLCYAFAKVSDVAAAQGKIDLSFTHMLSRVKFTFMNGFPSPQQLIEISDVKITDAASSGTIDKSTGEMTWNAGSSTFVIAFNTLNIAGLTNPQRIPGGLDTSNNPYKQDTDIHYLIPENVEKAYGISFKVKLMIYDPMTKITTEKGEWTHEVHLPEISFQPNYSYNFIATINNQNINPGEQMYPIEFNPTVGQWGDFDDDNIELPVKEVTPTQ